MEYDFNRIEQKWQDRWRQLQTYKVKQDSTKPKFLSKKVDKNHKSPNEFEKGYFMTAGRLTKQKNHIYLIREFKKFLKLYPNEKLILVGEGELKNKIKSEISNNNLSNNIKATEKYSNKCKCNRRCKCK